MEMRTLEKTLDKASEKQALTRNAWGAVALVAVASFAKLSGLSWAATTLLSVLGVFVLLLWSAASRIERAVKQRGEGKTVVDYVMELLVVAAAAASIFILALVICCAFFAWPRDMVELLGERGSQRQNAVGSSLAAMPLARYYRDGGLPKSGTR